MSTTQLPLTRSASMPNLRGAAAPVTPVAAPAPSSAHSVAPPAASAAPAGGASGPSAQAPDGAVRAAHGQVMDQLQRRAAAVGAASQVVANRPAEVERRRGKAERRAAAVGAASQAVANRPAEVERRREKAEQHGAAVGAASQAVANRPAAAERQRIRQEEEARAAEAAEQQRLADEAAEQQRLADEAAEQQRLAAEAAEQQRLADEAAEQQRLAAEAAARHGQITTERQEADRVGAPTSLASRALSHGEALVGASAEPLKVAADSIGAAGAVSRGAGEAAQVGGDLLGAFGNAASVLGGGMTFADGLQARGGASAASKRYGRAAMREGGREAASGALQMAGNIGALAGSEAMPVVGDLIGAVNDGATAVQSFQRKRALRGAAGATGDAVTAAKSQLAGAAVGPDQRFSELAALHRRAHGAAASTDDFDAMARLGAAERQAIEAGQIDELRGSLEARQGLKGGLAAAGAVGNTLSAVGSLTAAADGGVTKGVGLGIKAGVGGVKVINALRERWQGASDAVQAHQLLRKVEGKESEGAVSAFGTRVRGFVGLDSMRQGVSDRLAAVQRADTGDQDDMIGTKPVAGVGSKGAREQRYGAVSSLLRDRRAREADLLTDAAGGANADAANAVMRGLGMIDEGESGALTGATPAERATERDQQRKHYSLINRL